MDRARKETLWQKIVEFLPDATFAIDSNKKVIAWNRSLEQMTGVKRADIIGSSEYALPFYGRQRDIIA